MPGQSLRNSLDLARHVEGARLPALLDGRAATICPEFASAATAVALAHVAAGTNNIRLGRRRHHAAEHRPIADRRTVRTLARCIPGGVELGLGRAPGSDQITARAVRRALLGGEETFPRKSSS